MACCGSTWTSLALLVYFGLPVRLAVAVALPSSSLNAHDHGPTKSSRAPQADVPQHIAKAFNDFVANHKRGYHTSSLEYDFRLRLFSKRHAEVEAQNQRPDALWLAGVNHFTDLTDEELSAWRGRKGPRAGGRGHISNGAQSASALLEKPSVLGAISGSGRASPVDEITHFGWSNLTQAKRIPNQGACGSCWALTSIAVLEAHYEIHVDKQSPKDFSAQELVSCVPNPRHCGGKGGCDGATVELAMQYVMGQGLQTKQTCPYHAVDQKCDTVRSQQTQIANANGGSAGSLVGLSASGGGRSQNGIGLSTFRTLPSNQEEPLVQALVELGPVAVSVAADKWHMYQSGIFNSCGKDCVVDHAVTLYGFSSEDTTQGKASQLVETAKRALTKYWLIRNSWGEEWGEKGFIRLERKENEGSYCGVDNDPQKGVACDGDPSSVTVCGTCGVLYDSVVPCFEGSDPKGICAKAPASQDLAANHPVATPPNNSQNQAPFSQGSKVQGSVSLDLDSDSDGGSYASAWLQAMPLPDSLASSAGTVDPELRLSMAQTSSDTAERPKLIRREAPLKD